ncbi:MAG: radical SAM protein, partial [Pseudonocardiales bacterium]
FARQTHTYLDLDAGHDFDSRVVVKVNAAEVLRRELARRTWRGEHVAMGTNVDCYQRAEGRYQLMRGILAALRDAANPFSILTKGTLVLRDLDLLQQAAEVTSVAANVSVGFLDHDVWRGVESGTPPPEARLAACRTVNDAGIDCGVLMAPVLPYLTDSPQQLDQTVQAIAESGARHVSPIVLHVRPGAREWFMSWLGEHHPTLVPRYRELYGGGSYAPRHYTDAVTCQVRDLAQRYGITRRGPAARRGVRLRGEPGVPGQDAQLTLL